MWDKLDRGNAEKIVIPAKAGIQGFDFAVFFCRWYGFSQSVSALCVVGKTGAIVACKADVYFFGMLVATGCEMVL
ncbi:hypothetical protein BXU06_13095 [Aquaspirillum sp. LM1]|nr:hypothetical protein BXU06_13095 [Aquaspirillum sp. LM1]